MRRMTKLLLFVSLATVTSSPLRILTAQGRGLHEGARVRISTPTMKSATGVVQTLGSDTVVVFTEPFGAPVRVPRAEISAIEVSQGRLASEGAKKGAMWGAMYGVVSGAVIMLSTSDGAVDSGYQDNGYSSRALVAQNFVGSVGLGALIGALIKAERWSHVEVGGRVTVARSMVRAGLSVPFPRRF